MMFDIFLILLFQPPLWSFCIIHQAHDVQDIEVNEVTNK